MTSWSTRNVERTRKRDAPTGLAKGELRKSGETRERILTSAIDRLIQSGYPKLSVVSIAEGAGLTRAAAIYHFPNREILLRAIVDYLLDQRLKLYWEAVRDVPEDDAQIATFVDVYWDQVNTPIFVAFVELSMAARTDPVLAEIMQPALERYESERSRYSQMIFSHSMREAAGPTFETLRDVTRFLIEGMAIATMTSPVDPRRASAVKSFITQQMRKAYQPEAGVRSSR